MSLSILNIQGYLRDIRSGRKLYEPVGLFLMVAVLAVGVIGGIECWIDGWKVVDLGFWGWLGMVIWQAGWLIAAFFAIQTLFFRAVEIKQMPVADEPRFVVPPIIETVIRAAGEAIFVFAIIMALPAALITLLGGTKALAIALQANAMALAIAIPGGFSRVVTAMLALVGLPIFGMISLLISYFAADSSIALFSIAKDVNAINEGGKAKAE